MNTKLEQASQPVPQRPNWKRRILIAIPLLVLTGMIWWVMWGAAAAVPDELVTAKRGSDGRFHQTSDSVVMKGHLSTLQSNRSAATGMASTSSRGSLLRANSALISVEKPGVFAERVAHELFRELQKSNHFQAIHYLPPEETFSVGQRLPDLFITVGVESLDESGVVPYRSLDAKVHVYLSDRYRRSTHSYRGSLNPPVVNLRRNTSIDYSAREIGIETASARYQAVGHDLAGGIADGINGQLRELAEEHGTSGKTPPEFLPSFVPAPEFSFLRDLDARRILSGPAFMKQNVTIWRIPHVAAEANVIERIASALDEAGWEASKGDLSELNYLRVEKNDSTFIEVFPHDEHSQSDSGSSESRDWYFVYEQRMSEDDIRTALRAIFKRDVPESVLVQFCNWWYLERGLMEEYFREHPPKLTSSLRFLARERIDAGKLQTARELLLRADALYRIREPAAHPSHELERLAEEAGFEKFPEMPDLTALQDEDFVDLRKQPSVTLRLTMGESVILLLAADDHEQRYYCLTPIHHPAGAYTLRCEPVTLSTSGANWANQTQRISPPGDANEFQLSQSGGGPAFDARVTLLPDGDAIELMVEPHEG